MSYPYLKTKFKKNLDEKTIEIINSYWKIENGIFINSPTKLRNELNITQPKLNSIVKKNSETKLYIDDCIQCKKNPIIIPVTSQSNAKKEIENTLFRCGTCDNSLKYVLNEYEYSKRKSLELIYAFKCKYWTKLTEEELNVLKKIIEYDDYRLFWKDFIQKDKNYYYPIIHKLNRFSLIDVQRNPINERASTVNFLAGLKKELGIKRKNKNIHTESSLNFYLPKRAQTKNTDPNFSKRIVFDQNIVIKAGTEYICSVWYNLDGSINFKMKSMDDLMGMTDESDDFEPKLIGEFIKNIKKKMKS